MTSKFKPVLLLCLVFFAGIAVGVIGNRAVGRIHQPPPPHGMNPDLLGEKMFNELVKEVDLTKEQQEAVREIFRDTQKRLQELRSELGPRFGGIFRDAEERVRSNLNKEQQKKYEKFLKERKARWQHFSGGPGGGSRPFGDGGRPRMGDRLRERTNSAPPPSDK